MKKKIIPGTLTAVLLALGVFLCAFPVHGDGGNRESDLLRFLETQAQQSTRERAAQRNLAMWYNWNLTAAEPEPGFEDSYGEILCCPEGMMACLEIPALGLKLPVWHGTEEQVPERVYHVSDSSFPIGGQGNHTVLVGESTADGAFHKLHQLEAGERFYIRVLGEQLTYYVEKIEVGMPETTAQVRADEDLCTLVTPTPYGIYSHQLRIRGRRVPGEQTQIKMQIS